MKISEIVKASNGKLESVEVEKNGVSLTGICVQNADRQNCVSAVIYQEDVDRMTEDCETYEIAAEVVGNFLRERTGEVKYDFLGILSNPEEVAKRLQIRAMAEQNVPSKITPAKIWNGIAFCYHIVFADVEDGAASLAPSDTIEEVKEKFGLSDSELWDLAVKNTEDISTIEENPIGLPMTITSNKNAYFGISGILVSEDFRKKALDKMGSAFYVIPSSIHEAILYGEGIAEASDLKKMHLEVQESAVAPTDRLTKNIFLCKENGELVVAA